MLATLWIDVDDLFVWAQHNARPTGIQRLSFEICRTFHSLYGPTGLVQFVRHDLDQNNFRIIPWSDVATLFIDLTTSKPKTALTNSPVWCFVRKHVIKIQQMLRLPITDLVQAQIDALCAWRNLFHALAREVGRVLRSLLRPLKRAFAAVDSSADDFSKRVAPGDILLALGATWTYLNYAALVRKQRNDFGIRFGLLIYDLIPLNHPEWCGRDLVDIFRAWSNSMLPLCDFVFAISRATAADVETYAREHGIALLNPVISIPIGSGFGTELPEIPAPLTERLPPPGSYALFVSSIEPRKNHLLLFRVWRRMLIDLPREQVPTLVFAGRTGSGVDDLLQQIANTDGLNGKLVLIENPTDCELAALYQGCLFTLFPSFAEGWGLPVIESLAFGKPCLISNTTSLSEAGGALVRSFDPDNLHDAYAVIRNVVEDRAGLAQWQADIIRDFKPVPWSATIKALLAGLEHPLATSPFANTERASMTESPRP